MWSIRTIASEIPIWEADLCIDCGKCAIVCPHAAIRMKVYDPNELSVDGADVDIAKVVLHWNNRPDETIWNVGTVKAGGQTAAKSAPGHEGTLGSVTINYKILGGATTAKIKVWGYD